MRHPRLLGPAPAPQPASALWFEFSLAAAGIVSFGLSELVVSVIGRMGGYTSLSLPTQHFAAIGDIPHHLVLTAEGISILYGAFFGGMSPGWRRPSPWCT